MTTPSARRTSIVTDAAPQRPASFSQAVVCGNLVHTSGIVGLPPAGGGRPAAFADEVGQVLDSLAAVLAAAGTDLDAVLSTTCYLTSPELYAEFDDLYGARFSQPLPARAVVFTGLVGDLRVEVSAVAALPQ